MRRLYTYIILLLICFLSAQENYRSVEQIESEWGDHTTYQREEMISFCDFLFNEGHYERCLVSCFQFLYRLPNDPLRPAFLYLIARSYEEMGNYSLARRYYKRVIKIESENSIAYKASRYREVYSFLMEGNIEQVLKNTDGSEDPYFLILRGYSYFQAQNWEEARALFISAEERFDHRHYSKLMIPLYQAIENVSSVPQYSKVKVAMGGMILPGGGQFALKDWKKGQGVLTTVLLLYGIYSLGESNVLSGSVHFIKSPGIVIPIYKGVRGTDPNVLKNVKLSGSSMTKPLSSKSSFLQYTIPPLVMGVVLHIGSLIKSFNDTQEKNRSLIRYYALETIESISPKRFLDFREPILTKTQPK